MSAQMANETNLCAQESWAERTRNGGSCGGCDNAFSKFPAQLSYCVSSGFTDFCSNLTTSHYLSLSCARFSSQLGAIPKDFMETFSVSFKRFFWRPWSACLETVRRRAVSSGGGDLSCGQHD